MKVLIACEFSGIVRDAFAVRGHDAWSCDLLPTEGDPAKHIQGDVLEVLDQGWDLMIAHPPCTYLCNSGVRWLYGGKGRVPDPKRWKNMEEGAQFFKTLLEAPIPKKAVENPIPHRFALEIIGRKYDQVIQPWQYGHGETKATCLWLEGLPKMKLGQIVPQRHGRVFLASPGPNRWKERSRTLPGIATGFAINWG